ncbi:uncharacterized protein LOC125551676 isoform X3 [Triticum urartu]|uniref:Uncharacterized protein n=1 Tax=Triticum urartu TaxID=4572 RepID=A0A8R7RAG8_TRIUA|nr:uncharacterized protein LOC125529307 isoform X3 [Triticum urartu]XP_048570914.1 uncharacterized protein LOC125551676 isoform X3 [Triticum urartu]
MHLSENEGIEGVRFAVTVGQGFVGAALCLELIRRGALEVCSLDSSTCAIPPLGPSSSSTPASASYKVRDIKVIQMLLCHESVNLMRQHGLQAQEIPMYVSVGCRSALHSSA